MAPVQSPPLASLYRNTERKKTKREESEVAIMAVLSDGGMGGMGAGVGMKPFPIRAKKSWSSLLV
jgi:hypothetical protein